MKNLRKEPGYSASRGLLRIQTRQGSDRGTLGNLWPAKSLSTPAYGVLRPDLICRHLQPACRTGIAFIRILRDSMRCNELEFIKIHP